MTILSKALNAVGALLLVHACYSAQEHLSYYKATTTPASAESSSSSSSFLAGALHGPSLLPADITIETLVSVLLICLGLVLGSSALHPIQWRVWAARIERESHGKDGQLGELGLNPFVGLENRLGFWDIRTKRKEFDEWRKEAVVKT